MAVQQRLTTEILMMNFLAGLLLPHPRLKEEQELAGVLLNVRHLLSRLSVTAQGLLISPCGSGPASDKPKHEKLGGAADRSPQQQSAVALRPSRYSRAGNVTIFAEQM
jgi:hypothetical protein